MAEDILGITGIVNIDDIQKTFDTLINDLTRLGASTDVISARMTKALKDVANSSDKDLAAKTKAAMRVLNDAIAETNSQLRSTPEMIKRAEQEAQRLQQAIDKLEGKQGKTVVGSKQFNELNKQLAAERETLRLQNADIDDMRAAHEQAAVAVQHLQEIYAQYNSTMQETNNVGKQNASTQKQVQEAIADTQKTIDELVGKQEAAQQRMQKLQKDMQTLAQRGIEGGYIEQTGEGSYKANKDAAGYNENVVMEMQRIAQAYNKLRETLKGYRDEEALAREGMDELKESLREMEQQTQGAAQANEKVKSSNPRTVLTNLRNEITALTMQWRAMTDEEKRSAAGQELQNKLQALQKKASELQDAFEDVRDTIQNDASDTQAFSGLAQGLNLVISGFGAAQGAAAALGASEEDLARAQTVIQSSLAATNFLTEAQNALQSQSAVMRGINTLQTWAAAKAIDVETAAKGKNVVVTTAATVAQRMFNAVAKANPYVLLATAVLTVVGALTAYVMGSKKATEADKEQQEAMERAADAAKKYSDTLTDNYSNLMSKYSGLRRAWNELKSDHEREQWIRDNKNEFEALGLSVSNVMQAEDVFRNNTDKVVDSFKRRAEAAALAAQMTELYRQQMDIEQRATETLDKKQVQVGDRVRGSDNMNFYADKSGGTYNNGRYTLNQGVWSYTRKGAEEYNRQLWQSDEQLAKMNKEWKNIGKRIEEADKKLQQLGETTGTAAKPAAGSTAAPKQQQLKTLQELDDEMLAIRRNTIESELELEKEGSKRWEQLMRERIAIQAEIDKREAQRSGAQSVADLDASYKGGKSNLTQQQYQQRRVELEQQTQQTIAAIDARAGQDLAALTQERLQREAQSMLDYLKQYGTIQQQKYAIAKEYDDKIAQEQDKNKRKQLEAEKQSQLAQLNAQNLASGIDWRQTFDGVGNILQGIARQTLAKVDEYMSSSEFKKLSATDKKTYVELRSQLREAGGTQASNPFSGKVWQEIGDAAQRYRNSVVALNDANEHAEQVRKELTAAEQVAANNPADENAKKNVEELSVAFEEACKRVTDAKDEYDESQRDLNEKTEAVSKGFNNFNTVLSQITSGSLSGFATAVGNIIKKIGGSNDEIATNFGELFGEAGEQIGGLVGAILQIIDILGTEPAKFIDDLMSRIADVLEAVLSQLPQIIAAALKGVGNIIGGIFTGIGEGIAGIFGGGADWSAYDDAIDKWGHILNSWEDNLKYERELMEKAYGGDLLNLQKETLEGLKNTQQAAKEIYAGWHDSGAGWFSHSNGYEVNDSADWQALWKNNNDIAKKLGVQQVNLPWGSWYDGGDVKGLFDLDWEELEKLKYSNSKFWQSLHSETQKYLEQYIEAGKAMEEVQAETWEKLTTTTSDNTFDSFLNSLYELANNSEDVFDDIADSWQEMVNKMVINNLIGKNFQGSLNSWYEKLAKLNEQRNAGAMSDKQYRDELERLRQEYEGYVKDAQQQIEDYREAGIISAVGDSQYEQEASSKSWQSMSQDTADELNGRFTALYDSSLQLINLGMERNDFLKSVSIDVSSLRQYAQQIQGNVSEILDVQLSSLNHLENIDKHTTSLPNMDETISKIYNAIKNVNKK